MEDFAAAEALLVVPSPSEKRAVEQGETRGLAVTAHAQHTRGVPFGVTPPRRQAQLPLLLKGTSDDDTPCPGFLFEEIASILCGHARGPSRLLRLRPDGRGPFTVGTSCLRAGS